MGKISNSFKSQIGRDTGKVVSNMIWGDKHSTPYRRTEARTEKRLEMKERQLEAEIAAKEKEIELKERQQEAELNEKEELRLGKLRNQIQNQIKEITAIVISKEKEQLIDTMNELIIRLESNPFQSDSSQENKILNSYPEAILTKFVQCNLTFNQYFPSDFNSQYFLKAEEKFKKKRFWAKHGNPIIIGILLIVVFTFIGVMALMEK